MVKVVVPSTKEYRFPNICPRCLRPADTSVGITHTKHYVVVRRVERIDVPCCTDHKKEYQFFGVVSAVLWIVILLWSIFSLPIEISFFFVIALVIALPFLLKEIKKRIGVSFKTVGNRTEFTFWNPEYAELFKAANTMEVA